MVRFTLLFLACLALQTSCGNPRNLARIVLSYSEDNTFRLDCPSFRVNFGSGGHVYYECIRGCAAPGEQHHLVAAERFKDLVDEFHEEHFFTIARTDPSRWVVDVPVIRLTYRDERRIHEVVDVDRRNARITELENRFKASTEVDRYQKPSVSLYRSLLKAGWDINTLGADQQNALSAAVLHRDLESARFLVQHGSKVTRQTFNYAAISNNLEILRLIVESSAGELTGDMKTALLIQAARSSNVGLFQYVLSLGTDPNVQDPNSGLTPLMSAVGNDQLANAAILLAKGANPNARDKFNRCAIWYAAGAANTGFITMLLRYKAEVNASDNQGQTALMHATAYCYTWNIEALLKGGADPTAKDKRGKTAMPDDSADPKCKAAQKLVLEAIESRHANPR
jgi:ankyrin repeat protein